MITRLVDEESDSRIECLAHSEIGMLPWKTIIQIQKDCDVPVYLQIANSMIQEIKRGRIGPGIKLPGTRQMSELLAVHRKTVVNAYIWIPKGTLHAANVLRGSGHFISIRFN